jgi:hypothetical protein
MNLLIHLHIMLGSRICGALKSLLHNSWTRVALVCIRYYSHFKSSFGDCVWTVEDVDLRNMSNNLHTDFEKLFLKVVRETYTNNMPNTMRSIINQPWKLWNNHSSRIWYCTFTVEFRTDDHWRQDPGPLLETIKCYVGCWFWYR